MALLTCNFFSETLVINTSMTVILPQDTNNQIGMKNNSKEGKFKTLYLLHGYSDDHTIWTRRTSIERYVAETGIAVVMPQVDHSFYADMVYGKKYWTFISEELPRIARSFFPLSDKREDNFVAGLSMGGYGAFKWALRKPEMFAAAASLSGVLDLANREEVANQDDPIVKSLYHVYGNNKINNTEDDLFYLIKNLKEKNIEIPKLYQACGTEDFLFGGNKEFKAYTDELGIETQTTFDPGTHEWGYWDDHIQRVLKWLPL